MQCETVYDWQRFSEKDFQELRDKKNAGRGLYGSMSFDVYKDGFDPEKDRPMSFIVDIWEPERDGFCSFKYYEAMPDGSYGKLIDKEECNSSPNSYYTCREVIRSFVTGFLEREGIRNRD